MHEGREAGTFKGRQMLSNTLSSRAAVLGMSMPTPASALPDLRGSAAPPAASSPKRPTSSSCSDARLWCTQASMSPRYLRGSWACISMGRGMPPGPPRVRAAMILRTVAALHSPGWTIAAPDPSRPPASGSGLRPGAGKDFCQLACCSVRRRLLSAVPVIAIRKWVSWADDLHDAQAQRLHLWNRALCRVVATSIAQYLNRTGRSLRAWDACCSSGDTSGASISPRSRHLLCTHLHGGRRVLLTLVKSVAMERAARCMQADYTCTAVRTQPPGAPTWHPSIPSLLAGGASVEAPCNLSGCCAPCPRLRRRPRQCQGPAQRNI